MLKKKKILIVNGQYIPGYKGGGPIQSCANMIENLGEIFDFYVLTSDRDFKANESYKNIKANSWNQVGKAKVYYMSPNKQKLSDFNKVINKGNYDILYLNGFFSPIFTIRPLILRLINKINIPKVIITPRGDFTGGCENKKIKKYTYITLSKIIGLYKNLIWHTTSELEELDLKKIYKNAQSVMIPNLSTNYKEKNVELKKNIGEIKLIFLSRIFPKKNLKFALEVLNEIKYGNVVFDIYGPMEDQQYWNECKKIIEILPENIKVKYKGEINHLDVGNKFSEYHGFFFPTLGENYGHVIVEAMMNNCIPILSKGVTPWDDYIERLQLNASLNNKEEFKNLIEQFIKKDNKEYIKLIDLNKIYIKNKFNNSNLCDKYIEFFK
ncbi:glycosyltransferase [Clostridium perfringens]